MTHDGSDYEPSRVNTPLPDSQQVKDLKTKYVNDMTSMLLRSIVLVQQLQNRCKPDELNHYKTLEATYREELDLLKTDKSLKDGV